MDFTPTSTATTSNMFSFVGAEFALTKTGEELRYKDVSVGETQQVF